MSHPVSDTVAVAVNAQEVAAEEPSAANRRRAWWQKNRFWLLCAVLAVVVTLGIFVAGNAGERSPGPLSITNPGPAGGQAAASILARQGVSVTATDSLESTVAELPKDGPATVLVFDPLGLLVPEQYASLAASAASSQAKIVALSPGPLAVRALSSELSASGVAATSEPSAAAHCQAPNALAAGSIDAKSIAALAQPGSRGDAALLYSGTFTCFVPTGNADSGAGLLATTGDGSVTVLGNPAILSNDRLASYGNAALTLRTLGSTPHLIWYTASLADVSAAAHAPTIDELTPNWIFPAAMWLLFISVLGMLWRGRRLGPLAVEPLPVIVKSSETMTGRARLYQDARALERAARILQRATLNRLARALRLGVNATAEAVVDEAATRSSATHHQVHTLLLTAVPGTDKELLALAAELAALEEEIAPR